ncbi:MAG: A/G-specific adenine glycosylase [Anaerolineae bacterium]|nr:A/G-specific adenine glycosylase [Anaerolineae bacterium]
MSPSSSFAADLLGWYDGNGVEMPWRGAGNPYHTWLSEIMLQQTQVETVTAYFKRFLDAYPDVSTLAAAPLDDVLKLWEGLGYYSRARNLHRTAQQIISKFGGKFPHDVDSLQELPGIGRYTAGAISSIAFGARTPVVDGNAIRVLTRVEDIADDVARPATQARLWALAEAYLPQKRAGEYNQALMDLGRLICKPRKPLCETCPVRSHCKAYAHGTQLERPVKAARRATPHYDVTAGIIWNTGGELLIAQRPLDGLLGGLWEFPGGKQESGETLEECLRRELREELDIDVEVGELFTRVRHGFTHFKITLHAFTCHYRGERDSPKALGVHTWAWVTPDALDKYSFGKADRLVITELNKRPTLLL